MSTVKGYAASAAQSFTHVLARSVRTSRASEVDELFGHRHLGFARKLLAEQLTASPEADTVETPTKEERSEQPY